MGLKLVIGVILILVVVGVLSYLFVMPILMKEVPRIVGESNEACPLWKNFTYYKKILLNYKNHNFTIYRCGLSSKGEMDAYVEELTSLAESQGANLFQVSFEDFQGYSHDLYRCEYCAPQEQSGALLQKDKLLILCSGYKTDETYTLNVCEWYIEVYLK